MSTTKAPPVVLIENASEEMTSLIVEIREHNNAGMNERLRQGERFFKLRAAVGKYQKSNKDGLSYTASVALTGVALSTAERNRTMWEFTQNYQISGAPNSRNELWHSSRRPTAIRKTKNHTSENNSGRSINFSKST
jgi:hypothetical protein